MNTITSIQPAASRWHVGMLLAIAGLGAFALAGAQTPPGPVREKEVPYDALAHFTLIPKAFTPNPTLEMTVFTEVTEYGRTIAPPTPGAPVYFEAQDSGVQMRGFAMAGNKAVPREQLNPILHRTLAADGYLPAAEGHPPSLVLVYYWGSHNRVDQDFASDFPERAEQYVLERAALVGGKAYARELARGFDFGFSLGDRTQKKLFLYYQAADDMYYAVVSAYAYGDLARSERRLVWRTTMTVNARGVSMIESLPPLIVTAANYFGRPTTEPVVIRRTVRRGTVRLGPLEVVESDVPLTKPPVADTAPPPR